MVFNCGASHIVVSMFVGCGYQMQHQRTSSQLLFFQRCICTAITVLIQDYIIQMILYYTKYFISKTLFQFFELQSKFSDPINKIHIQP